MLETIPETADVVAPPDARHQPREGRPATLFAVGTAVTGRPPHRTARAEFPHAAPTLGV